MGQFQTENVVNYVVNNLDNSRLIDSASGGNHRHCGDFLDLHCDTEPINYLHSNINVNVFGKFGGIGLFLEEHSWGCNYSVIYKNNTEEVTQEYEKYGEKLIELIHEGFSAGIYHQLTDVECEVNGLLTYDRKEYKIIENRIRNMNRKIINSLR